jgi:L-iditol 2-dehydrogenase
MKALILSEYKKLDLVDMQKPQPGDDDLLIRVQACGICGSDVHGYDGSTGRRLPPIVMGHEAAGIVEAVGGAVEDFRPGDHVTFDSTVFCGRCFYCRRGLVNLCDHREVIGVSTPEFRRMGAFAEYVTVPARIAYSLPDDMPFAHAALIEAVSVAVHAMSLTPVALDDTVVVVGAGMIGLLALQAALLAGAGGVFVIDLDDTRLELARNLGATRTFNSNNCDPISEIGTLTSGRGADIALECVGISSTVKLAMDAVRKGAAVTLVGNVTPRVEIGLQSAVTRQIRLQGSCASSGEYPACISLISRGAIRVEPLLSAVAPLEEGAAWFRRLYAREPGLLKVVLQP